MCALQKYVLVGPVGELIKNPSTCRRHLLSCLNTVFLVRISNSDRTSSVDMSQADSVSLE